MTDHILKLDPEQLELWDVDEDESESLIAIS
jgi:hypothetical protein